MAALQIAEVAGGIWSVRRGPRFRPAFIVKMSPGAVLIDTGSEAPSWMLNARTLKATASRGS